MKAVLKNAEVSAFIFEEENDAFKAWCAENGIKVEWSGYANGGMLLKSPNGAITSMFSPTWGWEKYLVFNGEVETYTEDNFKAKYRWV